MYNSDIRLIKQNINTLRNERYRYSTSHAESILDSYDRLLDYIKGKKPSRTDLSKKPNDYFFNFVKSENNIMRNTKIIDLSIYKEMLNQDYTYIKDFQIPYNPKYDEKDVVDVVKSFYTDTLKNYSPFIVENLIDNKSIYLRKYSFLKGMYMIDSINKNNFIGVVAPTIESMMFALVHEIGHHLAHKESLHDISNNETLPILLELYFNDYIQNLKLDSSLYLQERFMYEWGVELETLKMYNDTYYSNDNDYKINRIKDLNNVNCLGGFEDVIVYALSKFRAIDYYRKTTDKLKTIDEIINTDKSLRRIYQFVEKTSPDVFSKENEALVKRLVRNE